jgi:hypothetical protein
VTLIASNNPGFRIVVAGQPATNWLRDCGTADGIFTRGSDAPISRDLYHGRPLAENIEKICDSFIFHVHVDQTTMRLFALFRR